MWADNETDQDLLGYDFVVDPLMVALTEPRLLPVTIGLLGDWGSGKSSVLKIVKVELEALGDPDSELQGRYLCVEFSPWRYEGYDDVKVALMNAVLEKLQAVVEGPAIVQVSRLRRFVNHLRRPARWVGRTASTLAPAAVPIVMGAIDPSMDPASLELVRSGVEVVAAGGTRVFSASAEAGREETGSDEPVLEIATFRTQFGELVESLDDLDAIVVLIDDLDRCLPDSVVDTFEAIRLFLNTEKTAFVVAANQQVVESAVDSRYPDLRRADGSGIGADYLEKMLQLKVAIPALSAAEAETYINLLLAELRLTHEQFQAVRGHVAGQRASNGFTVAFNLGVAEQVLKERGHGGVPAGLVKDLEWAARIAPALTGGLRGNPRQIKRFLNNLMLRSRSAARRKTTLDHAVLAKLMILEDQHFADFRRLFDWQMGVPGPIPQLSAAERLVRTVPAEQPPAKAEAGDGASRPSQRAQAKTQSGVGEATQPTAETPIPPAVSDWAQRPHVQAWLMLEPELGSTDLRPYFTYSREKLSLGVVVARLAPELQELVIKLQSDVPAVRRDAIEKVKLLGSDERAQIVEVLLQELVRLPSGPAFIAALELGGRVPDSVPDVCDALMRVPVQAIPPVRAQQAVLHLPGDHVAVTALLDRWQSSGIQALEGAVAVARKTRAAGRRGR